MSITANALISAVPVPEPDVEASRSRVLLSGELPSPAFPPSGCVFRTRCWKAQSRCASDTPALRTLASGHTVACHFPVEDAESTATSPTRKGAEQ
ncbi:MAG: oligopeptide/dipeptide ABC transporter ATP-binding protein [Nocardioidaceae bacterium]